MKKWAPFVSLNEQKSELAKMTNKRKSQERPQISQDAIDKINLVFINYSNEVVTIKYFHDGYIDEILTSFTIDIHDKKIETSNGLRINFIDILDIN
ncbi:MAG: YolD-like family protein [Bacilli bacterium]